MVNGNSNGGEGGAWKGLGKFFRTIRRRTEPGTTNPDQMTLRQQKQEKREQQEESAAAKSMTVREAIRQKNRPDAGSFPTFIQSTRREAEKGVKQEAETVVLLGSEDLEKIRELLQSNRKVVNEEEKEEVRRLIKVLDDTIGHQIVMLEETKVGVQAFMTEVVEPELSEIDPAKEFDTDYSVSDGSGKETEKMSFTQLKETLKLLTKLLS